MCFGLSTMIWKIFNFKLMAKVFCSILRYWLWPIFPSWGEWDWNVIFFALILFDPIVIVSYCKQQSILYKQGSWSYWFVLVENKVRVVFHAIQPIHSLIFLKANSLGSIINWVENTLIPKLGYDMERTLTVMLITLFIGIYKQEGTIPHIDWFKWKKFRR